MNTSIATTTPQEIQFQLVRMSSFNCFDGPTVADSLEANKDLWRGFIIDRAAYFTIRAYQEDHSCDPIDDLRLRDIDEGYWNVDTLYIRPASADTHEPLEALARTWSADEIDWQTFPNVGPVLRVWFD